MRFGEYAAEWKAGLSSTQNYYRVSQDRRRDAVDRVVALQFDRNGTRVWRKAQSLLDCEHVRRAIGEVSVPTASARSPRMSRPAGRAARAANREPTRALNQKGTAHR